VLKCWPTCEHAIDWSHDGIIALACDEQVELLVRRFWQRRISQLKTVQFPNTVIHDSEGDIPQWRHIPLQVPWFTKEELPVRANAPLPSYSIGEEISPSLPIGISWSPPGIAKHHRCALAVLTTNLALSIWTSDGKPQDESSWHRRLIINLALEDYFFNIVRDGARLLSPESSESLRLRRRVRAFTWAPSMHEGQISGTVGTQLSWGQPLIAVSNDDNEIILLAVNSPTSTLGVNDGWSSKVLGCFSITPESDSVISGPALFDEILQQQHIVSHISWSPWAKVGGALHSVLAYATNQDVRARVIIYIQDSIRFGPEVTYPNIDLRYAGPMKWSPKMEHVTLKLVLFTNTEVICLTVSLLDASLLQQASHHMDDRWDSISGVAFDVYPPNCTKVHFCSKMSSGQHLTALLSLTEAGLSAADIGKAPNWKEEIGGLEAEFGVEHDLKGNVYMKMWGLSASPLGDFIASCHTIHPTDMFEYGPPSDRDTTVTIRKMRDVGSLEFVRGNASAESVILTIKKWVADHVEDKEKLPEEKSHIQKQLLEVFSCRKGQHESKSASLMPYTSTDIRVLLTAFKQNVFLNTKILGDRFDILTSIACTPMESTDLARTMIAFRLATSIQHLPAHLSSISKFSQTVLTQSRQVLRFVQDLTLNHNEIDVVSGADNVEACGFCSASLPLTSLTTATCMNGHQFTRCGLSFLAIQFPGVTKYCGICNTSFFGDEFVAEQEEIVENETQTVQGEAEEEESVREEDGNVTRDMEIHDAAAEDVATSKPVQSHYPESGQATAQIIASDEIERESGLQHPLSPGSVISTTQTRAVDRTGTETAGHEQRAAKVKAHGKKHEVSTPDMDRKGRDRDLPLSLARVLFLGCDACIYCGGKYVG
jgi:hypothetical protein